MSSLKRDGYTMRAVVVVGANPCNICHGTHHHDHHRYSSQYRRARCLLLGAICARGPRIAVLRRHDRRDLFVSNWNRLRCHRCWFRHGRFRILVGRYAFSVTRSPTVRLVIGLLFAVPAARAGYEVTLTLAHIGISEMVAGVVRRGRRRRYRRHRLGPCVDADRHRSRTGRCPRAHRPPIGAATTGG